MGEVPTYRQLMDAVANWEHCSIPFSKTFGWGHWGLLGVLGDYVLHYTKGCIVEIGVCESSIFFTKLSRKYGRRVYHCDASKATVANCKTVEGYFDSSNVVYCGYSDDFFREIELPPVALGFIDGDHRYEQVKKDFDNLFPYVVPDGYVFLHDTYPAVDTDLSTQRCGTVYKLREELELRDDLECFTFPHSAIEVGLTMVRKFPENLPYYRRRKTWWKVPKS